MYLGMLNTNFNIKKEKPKCLPVSMWLNKYKASIPWNILHLLKKTEADLSGWK